MATAFRIPGNIKQQFLPFVLKPGSDLNKNVSGFSGSNSIPGGTGAQCFSFRGTDNNDSYKAGFAKLQICPSSLTNQNFGDYFKDDISYKLLFKNLKKDSKNNVIQPESGEITVQDIFNNLPGIQIREFLPDTKLDQCINFFGDMLQAVKDIWESNDKKQPSDSANGQTQNKDPNKDAGSFADTMKTIKYCLWHAFDYMTGVSIPNLFTKDDGSSKFKGNSLGMYYQDPKMDKLVTYMMTFPYTLYYRLQSCVTTNVYVLPCKMDDNKLYSSNGDLGWKGNNIMGITNTFLGKIPVIGDILKNILGNVQINFMPWWDAERGAQTPPDDVTVKFDLFNDTAEAAMKNFLFINTIIPNNRWVQYGMFQHSSNLYDIKLEGYNRMFACTGKFEVQGKGVLRNPPPSWVEELCGKYSNMGYKPEGGQVKPTQLAAIINDNNLVKIPDVYSVTMTFSSLLPSNFNNFLFMYSENNKIETACKSSDAYQEGAMATIIKAATTDFVADMKDYIKNRVEGEKKNNFYDKDK